jgi:membrane-associated protease RseP (regulator of RpoE activity)
VGALRVPPEQALSSLTPRFRSGGYTALVQDVESSDEVAIIAAPGVIQPTASRLWLALLLFVLTIASTIVTGAGKAQPNGSVIWQWGEGVMYSAALLSILLAHEMGHYIASRRLGVAVSYPFFIPLPIYAVFGTMGAFIQMKEPPPDRRALFSIAIAGPLAGLALAIPLTLLGLFLSTVQPFPTNSKYVLEGNNLLYAAMKWLVFGQWLPSGTHDVFLHPIAWAGWAGMLVTMFNLLPAGQLDGGHIIYALVGRRWAQVVTWGVIALLVLLGFIWNGWWLWAVLIAFLGNRHTPILDEVTRLGPRQRLLGAVAVVIFILLFMPTPLVEVRP